MPTPAAGSEVTEAINIDPQGILTGEARMPTPAAGSELTAAITTAPQVTLTGVASRASEGRLFNASGRARQLYATPLFAIGPSEPGPAIRRGFLLAVPIGLALILELGFDA